MFKEYRRTQIVEMCPWENGYSINGLFISNKDKKSGSPKRGDMIARNQKKPEDMWLVSKKCFEDNFEEK